MELINTRKRNTINIVQSLKSYLNVTNPSVISMTFIFLSCREKVRATKNSVVKFQNFSVNHESRAVKSNPGVNKWQN